MRVNRTWPRLRKREFDLVQENAVKFLSLALLITLSRQSTTLRAVMASSPSSNLLNLPPIRPNLSQTKSNSFTRSTSQSGSPNGGGNSSQVSRSSATATKRARSSSIVSVTEVKETYDDQLDQAALHNMNAEWVNYKGELLSLTSYSTSYTEVWLGQRYPQSTDALSLSLA